LKAPSVRRLRQRFPNFFQVGSTCGQKADTGIGVVDHGGERLIDLMGDGGGQFAHGRQPGHVSEIRLRLAQRCFGTLPFRNIVVGFEDRNRPTVFITPQRPPARHYHLDSICLGMHELAFPAPGSEQLLIDLIKRHREDRL